MKALISGATGMIGRGLLARVGPAAVLSRDPARAKRSGLAADVYSWGPESEPVPSQAFDGVDTVFHLAGEPVAEGRWTAEKKTRIRESRVLGTRNLVASLRKLSTRPKVLVAASAVGYYGDRGDEAVVETSSAGVGFLAEVCEQWEREALAAQELGIRVVTVRIGIVLAPGEGALAQMVTPFRLGVGGRLGDGGQWMPWIHMSDVTGLFIHAAANESVRGAVNAVSPNPVTNAEFTEALAHVLHRPAVLAVPRLALRVAYGEISDVLLASQRVLPRVAVASGYRFEYEVLATALSDVMSVARPGEAA